MNPTDTRTLVDHYIDAYNRKDIDDMLRGVHPQVEEFSAWARGNLITHVPKTEARLNVTH